MAKEILPNGKTRRFGQTHLPPGIKQPKPGWMKQLEAWSGKTAQEIRQELKPKE